MPGRLLRREAWTPLIVTFAVLIMCGLAVLSFSVVTFVNDQERTDQLTRRTALLAAANTKLNTELCRLATGLALYQPNLSQQVVDIINEIIGELPPRCFP